MSFEPGAAGSYWVALIETAAPAGPEALCHWAAGNFQIGGLTATTPGSVWPAPTLPVPVPATLTDASGGAPGTRHAAYLEIWERHVTGVEDPGIVEQALGGEHDTSTRTELRAEVRFAEVTGGLTPNQVAEAIAAPTLPAGTVTLGVSAGTTAADPCDLPVPGGYTGPENRLYRLAVHSVTAGETLFKWSRENGAELYPVTFPPPLPSDEIDSLIVRADLPLRDGDLVELRAEATDVGDAASGTVTAAGFSRPVRSEGRLLRLSGGQQVDGANRVFTFRDPRTEAPIASIDPEEFGTIRPKVRRWSGLIVRPGVGAADEELEHGIRAEIDGAFEPGAWWQFEARTGADNANGPSQPVPHGPERLFAPLALLESTAPGQPMQLIAWLDQRYPRLCELHADDVDYDGGRSGTDADTVQEALDELYLRVSEGCGEIAVPLEVEIQDVMDQIPAGGSAKICLNVGVRDLNGAVTVANKGDLIVGGIGGGTELRTAGRSVFVFRDCSSVSLRDFAVRVSGSGGSVIYFENCGEVTVEGISIESRAATGGTTAAIRAQALTRGATRRVTIRDNRIELGHGDSGVLLIDPGEARVEGNRIGVRDDRFDLRADIATPDGAAAAGNVLIDRVDFHEDDEFDFVGGAVLDVEPFGPRNQLVRRGIVMAPRVWGRSVLSFNTDVRMFPRLWDAIAEANPGPERRNTTSVRMRAHIRRLRLRLARAMLGADPQGPVTVPPIALPAFSLVAGLMFASNMRISGTAGIVVAFNETARRGRHNRNEISQLFPQGQGQTAIVARNHIAGFRQGIRIGAARDPLLAHLVHSADVTENHVELRLPMQSYQRGGVILGNTLTARITGNRVENLDYDATFLDFDSPERAPVDCDGIRLWGHFGPLVQVNENMNYGTTVGVRLNDLKRAPRNLGRVQVVPVRTVEHNAYVGDGVAQVILP